MREFIITEAKSEEAVLVGLITKNQNEEQAREYLDELEFLSSTAGVRTVRRFTQRLDQAHSREVQEDHRQALRRCRPRYASHPG